MVRRLHLPVQTLTGAPDEGRYALATAAGGVAVWDWDLSTNDIFVDPSLRTMLGYDDAVFRDRVFDWVRIVHLDDRAFVLSSAQACLAECGARFEVEHRMLHNSGETRWFVTRGSVLCDKQGNAIRMLGTATDVTDRKLAQLAVRESEERFRQLAENTPQIFWLLSADLQQMLYINPAYEDITGRPCSELYTDPSAWLNAVHPEDRLQVSKSVWERQTGARSGQTHMEYRYLRPDGTVRWMRAVIIPILDERGKTYRISGIAEDITESKVHEAQLRAARADLATQVEERTLELTATVHRLEQEIADRARIEEELLHSELRFRRLFDSNIIGAMICSIHGVIHDANDAVLKIIGYSREDLPLRWDKMTPPEWHHTDERALDQLAQNGIAPPWEKEYIRKDGSRVPILLGVAMLEGDDCICFVLELTELKAAEEEIRSLNTRLDQASRLSVMGEMVAGLAHEVHQPLAVIANYATGTIRRMKQGKASVKEIGNRLQEIASESMRAADVLRKIRQFLQRRETEREETHLNAVVQDALKLARFDREANHVEIVFQPESGLPVVFADPIQVTQVILNLVLNAIQAMTNLEDRNRRITIETRLRESDLAEVTVSDSGSGVPPELQPKIFEQFFTTKSHGLGMGLSISRSIVEAHGGQLWYEAGESHPSVFRFTLPTRRATPANIPSDVPLAPTANDVAHLTGDAG